MVYSKGVDQESRGGVFVETLERDVPRGLNVFQHPPDRCLLIYNTFSIPAKRLADSVTDCTSTSFTDNRTTRRRRLSIVAIGPACIIVGRIPVRHTTTTCIAPQPIQGDYKATRRSTHRH